MLPPTHHDVCIFRSWRQNNNDHDDESSLDLIPISDSVALVDEARGAYLVRTESPSDLVVQFGASNDREGSVPLVVCSTSKEEDDSN